MIPALARVPRLPRSWPASEVAARRCMGWAPVCAQPVVGTARESVSGVLGYLLSDLGDHAGGGRRTYDVCAARSWRPVAFWPVRLAANRREARSPWSRRR